MSIYATDVWGINKLCIKDPWNAVNANPAYHGDAASTWPCHYDYAIVHVPTMLAQQSAEQPMDNSLFLLIFGFGLAGMLLFGFSIGQRIFYK